MEREILMKEAEVSIRVALHYICNNNTKENVQISIDGAHIRTKDTVNFDIFTFLKESGCKKLDGNNARWQGLYEVHGYEPKIEISSQPGIGDVNYQRIRKAIKQKGYKINELKKYDNELDVHLL